MENQRFERNLSDWNSPPKRTGRQKAFFYGLISGAALILAACTPPDDRTEVAAIRQVASESRDGNAGAVISLRPPGHSYVASSAVHSQASHSQESTIPAFRFRTPHTNYRIGDWRDSTQGYPYAVAIGDVTRDGKNDIVMVTLRNYAAPPLPTDHKVMIFAQGANGELLAPTLHPYSDGLYSFANNYIDVSLALADMNLDGYLDIVVGYGRGVASLISTPAGFDTGKYLIASEFLGQDPWNSVYLKQIAVLDLDRDGYKDIVAFNAQSGATAFYGQANGGFTPGEAVLPMVRAPTDVKISDWNGDGAFDIAVLSGHRSIRTLWLIENRGTRDLQPQLSKRLEWDETYSGLALGDWSGDNRQDIAISVAKNIQAYGLPAGLLVFEQIGEAVLGAPYSVATWEIPNTLLVEDLDGDRVQDILIDHPGWDVGYILKKAGLPLSEKIVNNGSLGGEGQGPQVIAAGDINSDGCTDLARVENNVGLMVYNGENCAVYRNVTGGRLLPERLN